MKPTWTEHQRGLPPETRPGEWPRLEHEARQTGRTTRMMEAAEKASREGCAVYIVVHDKQYARELERRFRTKSWPTAVFFHTPDDAPFGLQDREAVEAKHYARRVFIGHEAIENHPVLSKILVELHRFDRPHQEKK